MPKIRRVPIGKIVRKDARGWVLDPLPLAGLERKPLGNMHVASMQPGAVRGNHFHENAAEWVLFCGGPAVLIADAGDQAEREEILISGEEPEFFEIPAGLPHAIENRSDREIFLVVFYADVKLHVTPAKIL